MANDTTSDQVFKTVNLLFRLGFYYLMIVEVVKAIGYLAGKETSLAVTLVAQYLTTTGAGLTLSVSFAVNVGFYYLWRRERQLRYDKVEYLGTRNAKLEKIVDQKRTSTELAPDGRTNPRDD